MLYTNTVKLQHQLESVQTWPTNDDKNFSFSWSYILRRSSNFISGETSPPICWLSSWSWLESSVEALFCISYFPIIPRFCLYFDGSKPLCLNQDSNAKNFHLATRLRYGKNPINAPKDTFKAIISDSNGQVEILISLQMNMVKNRK